MIRSELVQKLVEDNPHLYQRDVEKIVNTIFEEIIETMAGGDRVELRGFGAFSVQKRRERIGRNPKNNEVYIISRRKSVSFSAAKYLKNKINRK